MFYWLRKKQQLLSMPKGYLSRHSRQEKQFIGGRSSASTKVLSMKLNWVSEYELIFTCLLVPAVASFMCKTQNNNKFKKT